MKLVHKQFIERDDDCYPVIKTVNLLQKGWELDYEAHVVDYGENTNPRYALIWSDHGDLYDVPHPIDVLEGFIREYENYIAHIKDAMEMLK